MSIKWMMSFVILCRYLGTGLTKKVLFQAIVSMLLLQLIMIDSIEGRYDHKVKGSNFRFETVADCLFRTTDEPGRGIGLSQTFRTDNNIILPAILSQHVHKLLVAVHRDRIWSIELTLYAYQRP